jgi:uncharacterized protein (DUF1697 family)
MPMNPNMRNEKLRGVFGELGFESVQTVISSGNVIFASSSKSITLLETTIEKALTARLGITSKVIVRSKKELEKIIHSNPFDGKKHDRTSYLVVTFMKQKPREVFTALDLTQTKTPNFMTQIEKKYGKDITTRTWMTVDRIYKKM